MPRTVLGTALDLLLPRTCPGCGGPEPWCRSCAASLAGRPRLIALPQAALDRCPPPVHALARYTGPARAAIIAAKERDRRDLIEALGAAFAVGLARLDARGELPHPIWMVPGPSRRSSARARGGDPVTRMARVAARRLAACGTPVGVAPCVYTSRWAADSVGLSAAERWANLRGRIHFRGSGAPPPGRTVVLVDDVLTTGATLLAAAAALEPAGHRIGAALVLAAVPPWVTPR